MALAFTVVESGYLTPNASTFDTNDASTVHDVGDGQLVLTADRLYYMFISADRGGGSAVADAVTHDNGGTPLSLTNITGAFQATPVGDAAVQVWKVVPVSTTADASILIDFTITGSHSQCIWCVVEITGFDTTGTEVQVQKANGTASPASVTMSAYGDANNAVISVVSIGEFATGETITGEHTELSDIDDTERMQQMVQVQNPATDTTPSATYTEPGSEEHAIIGIEVKADVASATIEQEGYQWRQDDNSEALATDIGAQDAALTREKETNTRLRVLLNATGDPATSQFELQYRRQGGTYRKVPV